MSPGKTDPCKGTWQNYNWGADCPLRNEQTNEGGHRILTWTCPIFVLFGPPQKSGLWIQSFGWSHVLSPFILIWTNLTTFKCLFQAFCTICSSLAGITFPPCAFSLSCNNLAPFWVRHRFGLGHVYAWIMLTKSDSGRGGNSFGGVWHFSEAKRETKRNSCKKIQTSYTPSWTCNRKPLRSPRKTHSSPFSVAPREFADKLSSWAAFWPGPPFSTVLGVKMLAKCQQQCPASVFLSRSEEVRCGNRSRDGTSS